MTILDRLHEQMIERIIRRNTVSITPCERCGLMTHYAGGAFVHPDGRYHCADIADQMEHDQAVAQAERSARLQAEMDAQHGPGVFCVEPGEVERWA